MSRTLALLRHAKSDWSAGLDDRLRPLNQRGRHDAPRIGQWLQDQDWRPDYILSSPAQRARETLLSVAEAARLDPDLIHWDNALYLASADTLLQVIHDLPATAVHVMLVGHNPGLEDLLMMLSADPIPPTADGKCLTTANLALLQFDCDWDGVVAQAGRMLALIRPKEISH